MADSTQVQQLCAIEDCGRPRKTREWCGTHYARWTKTGDPLKLRRTSGTPVCDVPECDQPSPGHQTYCQKHRKRLEKTGSLQLAADHPDYFYVDARGYVVVKRPGHPIVASPQGWVRKHRVVLYDAIGPGWHSCHVCGMQVSWDLAYPEHRNALVVDHIDEDKSNNDPSNLAPSCAVCNIQRSSHWVKRNGHTVFTARQGV